MEAVAVVASKDGVIVRDPSRCGGAPSVAGTRTAVHDVVIYTGLYGGDLTRVQAEALPHLTLDQVRAAMSWYEAHQDEIDEIMRARRAYYESGQAKADVAG